MARNYWFVAIILVVLNGCLDSSDSPVKPAVEPAPDGSWVSLCGIENKPPSPSTNSFGLQSRISPNCLKVSASIGAPTDMVVKNAYPNLSFERPVDLAKIPESDFVVVAEHRGKVKILRDDPSALESSIFLDISDQVGFDHSEQGLVKLTFDPDYVSNGFLYVTYAGKPSLIGDDCGERCSVISRFKRSENNPLEVDLQSEEVILMIPQPQQWHNAGHLYFGPEGYLYVGIGDGGFGSERNAQDRTNLFGSILRIDVSKGLPYQIPMDNPFANNVVESEGVIGEGSPVRPEIWVYGLRNPHRFSIDSVTGKMIVTDVGYFRREEINVALPGDNFGWNAYEGSLEDSGLLYGRQPSDLKAPVFEYDHDTGQSITGGHVYRGTEFPNLFGRYIYADFSVGTIWALDLDDASNVLDNTELANAGGISVSSIALFDEEIYLTNLTANKVQKLAMKDAESEASVPQLLSKTGIFDSLSPLIPGPGMIPYGVNSPLWSDGAEKSRWMIIPDGKTITFDEESSWEFPEGSVLIKHFSLDLDSTASDNSLLNLETRMLVNTKRGWIGYTYQWNDAQTEATLLTVSDRKEYSVLTDSGAITQEYYFPSTADCSRCHNSSDGYVLGIRTKQLNSDFDYHGVVDNQLRSLNHIELFSEMISLPLGNTHTYKNIDDDSATLEARARSYLASNCGYCHNADAGLPTPLDFRYLSDDVQLNAINLIPQDDFGLEGAKVIDPGNKENSVLWLRMGVMDSRRMPPLATHVVDEKAVDLIGEWIDNL